MKTKITEIIKETYDTKTFRFEKHIDFKPGQFIMITVPIDDKEIKRSYSISSSPLKPYIDITIKKAHNGFISKKFVDEVKVNDEFQIEGPFGHFTYSEEMANNLLLISAGSGITPLRSILQYALEKNPDAKMTLLYSVKTEKDIIFEDELNELNKKENFTFIPTITRDENWQNHKGRIDKEFLKENINNELFYICGPPGFVNSMSDLLQELGVEKNKIKTERFG